MAQDHSPSVHATFMGVTTISLDDGRDSILIDGFFTRPWYFSSFLGWVKPDESKIRSCLRKAGIENNLRAVFVAHSHFDHALDSPTVCKQTGAQLIGSSSTKMIAKGQDLPESQILVVSDDFQKFEIGSFRITVIKGVHSPGDIFPGEITEPVQFPCALSKLRTAECYSYLIEHGEYSAFIHPSANFLPGKLNGLNATTLFLGVGGLGKQLASFQNEYWEHVVAALNPKKIIPIHWDNLWLSLEQPLQALPWIFDNFPSTKEFLLSRCAQAEIHLSYPQAWEVFCLSDTKPS